MQSRIWGTAFVGVGLALLGNPLYLDGILCEPCAWTVTPFYFAVATATGTACVLAGLGILALPPKYRDRTYLVPGTAFVVLASTILYRSALPTTLVPGGTWRPRYVDANVLVAAVVAAAFLVGVGIAVEDLALIVSGGVIPPVAVGVVAGSGPISFLFLAGITPAIIGIPLEGILAFALGIGLACLTGVTVVSGAGETPVRSSTATRPEAE